MSDVFYDTLPTRTKLKIIYAANKFGAYAIFATSLTHDRISVRVDGIQEISENEWVIEATVLAYYEYTGVGGSRSSWKNVPSRPEISIKIDWDKHSAETESFSLV